MLKFKRQYRWLLFILIPFVIILSAHIIVPLLFLFKSQPIAVQNYTRQNTQGLMISLRSFVIQQAQQVSALLNGYISQMQLMSGTLLSNSTFLNINSSQLDLNNAYQYHQLPNTSAQALSNRSMWFANGAETYAQLNQNQQKYYEQYAKTQPFLRYNFQRQSFSNFVEGIYVSFNVPGEQICFHYPSYQENAFSNINGNIMNAPYQKYLQSFEHNQTQLFLVDHFGQNHFSQNLLSICTSLIEGNVLVGVLCFDVNLKFAMDDLNQLVQMLYNEAIGSDGYLLKVTNSTVPPQILAHTMIKAQTLKTAYPENATYNSLIRYGNTLWPKLTCNVQSSQTLESFSTLKIQTTSINVVPICVNQGQLGWIPIMYYSLQVQVSDLITDLNGEEDYKSILQTLLIVIILTIMISLVLTLYVLKVLLTNLDQELYKLHKCCKFIANGDTDIQIPTFNGTKDIARVYQEVKTINKLFRYTSNDYFVGHPSNKLLKYLEAVTLFKQLDYNLGNLYQNVGECYWQMTKYKKAIVYLKLSVDILEQQMAQYYQDFQSIKRAKDDRQAKIHSVYKQKEILMIRRLWKLYLAYITCIQLKKYCTERQFRILSEEAANRIRDQYILQMSHYVIRFKQVLYPDYASCAEGILMFLIHARFLMQIKRYNEAEELMSKVARYTDIYSKEFNSITEKLKEKGSRNRLLFKKQKMTRHSRMHPHILETFCMHDLALLELNPEKQINYYQAVCLLLDSFKKAVTSQALSILPFYEIMNILKKLQISPHTFQTTQIFRQLLPEKTLYYGPQLEDVNAQFMKFYMLAEKNAEVDNQKKQYVFLYDTGSMPYSTTTKKELIDYFKERSDYIFDKQMKGSDRLSLAKFNSVIQLQTFCNLTFKAYNEEILKKNYEQILQQSQYKGRSWLLNALNKVIFRVQKLQCQKIIVVFLRPIHAYLYERDRRKNRSKTRKSSSPPKNSLMDSVTLELPSLLLQIGEGICEMMSEEEMRNCKLVLMCAKVDDESEVKRMLGLRDINRRIWAQTEGLNIRNNIVYVVSQKHKVDIERILKSKVPHQADNHVFVL